jgi:hypothetical protein
METKLIWINKLNGAWETETRYFKKAKEEFPNEKLIAIVCGVAYGGSIEAIAQEWKDVGVVYGYDTFEGHPKHICENPEAFEATCMDNWYRTEVYGTENLSVEYQNSVLKELGLNNFRLVKGLINKNSWDDIEKVHYVMLDLDIAIATEIAYHNIKNKIVENGYLLLHDCIGHTQLPQMAKLYQGIKDEGLFNVLEEHSGQYLVVLQKT